MESATALPQAIRSRGEPGTSESAINAPAELRMVRWNEDSEDRCTRSPSTTSRARSVEAARVSRSLGLAESHQANVAGVGRMLQAGNHSSGRAAYRATS